MMNLDEIEDLISKHGSITAQPLMDLVVTVVLEAVAAEREACAKVCEETDLVDYEHCMVLHTDGHATLRNAAAAIRARGEG